MVTIIRSLAIYKKINKNHLILIVRSDWEKLQMHMIKLLLTTFIYFCLSFSAFADSNNLNKCVSFSDNELRLKCYDAISKYNSKQDSDTDVSSTWNYTENIDDFTDKNTSRLSLWHKSGSQKGDSFPDFIVMRCDGKGNYDIYVGSSGYIGGEKIPVKYRFGNEEFASEIWHESTDGTAAFYPSSYRYKAKTFSKMLTSGQDFILSLENYQGSQSSAKFDNSIHPKFNFILGGCTS